MSEAPPKHLETVLDMSKLNFFNASHGSSYSASSIVDFALNQQHLRCSTGIRCLIHDETKVFNCPKIIQSLLKRRFGRYL